MLGAGDFGSGVHNMDCVAAPGCAFCVLSYHHKPSWNRFFPSVFYDIPTLHCMIPEPQIKHPALIPLKTKLASLGHLRVMVFDVYSEHPESTVTEALGAMLHRWPIGMVTKGSRALIVSLNMDHMCTPTNQLTWQPGVEKFLQPVFVLRGWWYPLSYVFLYKMCKVSSIKRTLFATTGYGLRYNHAHCSSVHSRFYMATNGQNLTYVDHIPHKTGPCFHIAEVYRRHQRNTKYGRWH